MPLALVGQALAGRLEAVLAARLLFGLSFGILWVIGPARAAAGGRGAGGTGPLIAASGAGWLVGPVIAGAIADASGWRVASALLAVLTLPLVPLVARYAAPRLPGEYVESLRLRAAVGLVRRNRAIAGAALVSALLGVVGGVSGVLVPLALDAERAVRRGGSGSRSGSRPPSGSASASVVGRLRASAVHLRGVGIVVAVLAAPGCSRPCGSDARLVASWSSRPACRSTINALNYAVGVRASARRHRRRW